MWLIGREELSLSTPLDFQAIPYLRYVTLSQFGTPGSTKNVSIRCSLNKLRTLELATPLVEYIGFNDPTT